MTEKLRSALVRKDMKDIIVTLLTEEGKEAEAQEVRSAGRITKALIDRTCGDAVEAEPTDEQIDAEINEEIEADSTYDNIIKAINKGKGKKALKLIKQAKEDGHSGSELKKLKEQAKEL